MFLKHAMKNNLTNRFLGKISFQIIKKAFHIYNKIHKIKNKCIF